MIHKSCFMYKEKNNLLPRELSGGLTKEVTFDLIHKRKVRLWDQGQGIPQIKLYLHGIELSNFRHLEHRVYFFKKSSSNTHINSNRDARVHFIEFKFYLIRSLLEASNRYNHVTKYEFQKHDIFEPGRRLIKQNAWHANVSTLFISQHPHKSHA